jgi:hypothetical protein
MLNITFVLSLSKDEASKDESYLQALDTQPVSAKGEVAAKLRRGEAFGQSSDIGYPERRMLRPYIM